MLFVVHGRVPSIYPLRRRSGVVAPQRVGPRIEPEDDGFQS